MAPTTLLRGGTVLVHDAKDHVQPLKADLLIRGNIIVGIAANIAVDASTTVIDCTEKIISPGFIDTHHHVWQTQLKGRHANELLLDYMYTGSMQSSNYSPNDIFWGELGGCLEMLAAGTTTVVDFAHMNYSPEHVRAGISATVNSGIRSVFCYCPHPRLESWAPFTMAGNLFPEWMMQTFSELAAEGPFGDGRVELGFAFDGYFLPKEIVIGLFETVKNVGIKIITSHYCRGAVFGQSSLIDLLESYGLLDSTTLIAHANNAIPSDALKLQKAHAHISSTPSTELQMALGTPVCFDPTLDVQSISSLGIDCHSTNSGSIPSEIRLALQFARGTHNQKYIEASKSPKTMNKTVEEAFNLGTIQGARAIGREAELGSLKVGKLADIVVFDATTPSMICAAQFDPVAAVVLHSSPGDVWMTIVDGNVRKAEGVLRASSLDEVAKKHVGNDVESVTWKDVATELLKGQKELQLKIDKIDMVTAREEMIKAFYINEANVTDVLE